MVIISCGSWFQRRSAVGRDVFLWPGIHRLQLCVASVASLSVFVLENTCLHIRIKKICTPTSDLKEIFAI